MKCSVRSTSNRASKGQMICLYILGASVKNMQFIFNKTTGTSLTTCGKHREIASTKWNSSQKMLKITFEAQTEREKAVLR